MLQPSGNIKKTAHDGPNGSAAQDGALVARALMKAMENLSLTQKELSKILHVSPSHITKLRQGTSHLSKDSSEFELALLFLRLYRSLGSLYGGNLGDMAAWMRTENRALRGQPKERILSIAGLADTVSYLDMARAKA